MLGTVHVVLESSWVESRSSAYAGDVHQEEEEVESEPDGADHSLAAKRVRTATLSVGGFSDAYIHP
mgnify:CR=1 FL=1